jgi:hypothetical protein
VRTWPLNISDLNWQINSILLSLEWSEQGIDVLSIIWVKYSFRVLNFKNTEVVIVLIQSFENSCVDRVGQLSDSEVLHFNWVG